MHNNLSIKTIALLLLITLTSACIQTTSNPLATMPPTSNWRFSAKGIHATANHADPTNELWYIDSITIDYSLIHPRTLENIAILVKNHPNPVPLKDLTSTFLLENATLEQPTDSTLYMTRHHDGPDTQVFDAYLQAKDSEDIYHFITTSSEVLFFQTSVNQSLRNKDLIKFVNLKTNETYASPLNHIQLQKLLQTRLARYKN
ncbi:hypothetical protein JD969_06695 [Planctomycetota bacterium]|nr:hypothetical protein JD969_06695 [Planctomycetota bacterium]